nr:CARDB domain-containing protein [Aquicoccus sp. G2-2]MEA1112959.1 CARDB domain-containing protein [Aquicoccus sp. G2-2]
MENTGPLAAGARRDAVILSRDAEFGNDDDITLGFADVAALAAGVSREESATVTLPVTLDGAYFVAVRADVNDAVEEGGSEANNLSDATPMTVAPANTADLVVEAVAAPTVGNWGDPIQVSWRVANDGDAAASGWTDRAYLSADGTLDAGDLLLAEQAAPQALAPGQSYTATAQVEVPGGLTGGYYVIVVTDSENEVEEGDGEANNSRTALEPLTISARPTADLAVTQITGPARAAPGTAVTVGWSVANEGEAEARAPFYDQVYLTQSGGLSGARYLGYVSRNAPLAAGSSYDAELEFTMPELADGTWAFLVVSDAGGQVYEQGREANNTLLDDVPLGLDTPDLQITNVSAPESARSGDLITLAWTVENAGGGVAANDRVDRVYLSRDGVVDAGDVVLVERAAGLLEVGGTQSIEVDVELPLAADGAYQLLYVSDARDEVAEKTGEDNNLSARAFTVDIAPYADLAVSDVTAPSLTVADPATIIVGWTVSNLRDERGKETGWEDQIYASRDSILGDGDDFLLGSFEHHGALDGGQSYRRSEAIDLPAGFSDRLIVYVVADYGGEVFENGATANNRAATPGPVDVTHAPYADLEVSSIAADATAQSGTALTLQWVVENDGIGLTNSAQWNDRIILARNPDGSGVVASQTYTHLGALAVGETYQRSGTITVPNGLEGTFYVRVETGGPYEFVHDDNNASALREVSVTLAPSPDLQVVDIATLETASEGAEIDIAWRVVNAGEAAAEGRWNDRVMLVPIDASMPVIQLGSFVTERSLAAGGSYQRTERVLLPARTEGAYRLSIVTNYGSGIYEHGAAADNNTGIDDRPVTIALNPRANLAVASIIVAPTVSAGGGVQATFEIVNQGSIAATGTWQDSVYLSLDDKLSSDDILISRASNPTALANGERYSVTSDIGTVPLRWAGDAYVLVSTDSNSRVDEYPFEGDNVSAQRFTVEGLPRPDLVTSEVVAPSQAVYGSEIEVRYRVTNMGVGATLDETWRDTIWITRDARRPNTAAFADVDGADFLKGNSARLLGTVTHSGYLAVGDSYDMVVRVSIPQDLPSGKYYITPWSDSYDAVLEDTLAININPDDPSEIDNNNYKGRAIDILGYEPVRPDLVVSDVSSIAPVLAGTDTLDVSWTVSNDGLIGSDGGWVDRVYLSDKPEWGAAGATLWTLGDVRREAGLAAGETYRATAQFDLPPTAAGQYVHVITDASVHGRQAVVEENEDNNVASGSADVRAELADLRVISVSASTDNRSGEVATVSWTVENVGAAVWDGSEYWQDSIWISRDKTFIRNRATHLASVIHSNADGLSAGGLYSETAEVTIPAGYDGVYYLHVATDTGYYSKLPQSESMAGSAEMVRAGYTRSAAESGDDPTGNFGRGVTQVLYQEPDLVVSDLVLPTGGKSGESLSLVYTVTNSGNRATREGRWNDRVYLSRDGSLDSQDYLLGSFMRDGALGIGESYMTQAIVDLPLGIEGDFHVIVETDSRFREGNVYQGSTVRSGLRGLGTTSDEVPEFQGEGNNRTSGQVTVEAGPISDLEITGLSIPQRAVTGQPFTLSYDVSNTGLRDSGSGWRDLIYLSRDETLDPRRDFYLGFVDQTDPLGAGESRDSSASVKLPKGLSGSYYVFILSDRTSNSQPFGAVFEGSGATEENIKSSAQPLLIEQNPPSDLVISDLSVSGGETQGADITVGWTITNASALADAEGEWSDAVYLSRDGAWDIEDIFLGRFTHDGGLAQGESYAGSLTTRLPVVADGAWRVILRGDARNDVPEGAGEANNELAAENALSLTSPLITLNEPSEFNVTEPGEYVFRLNVPAGETLRVRLAGGDPLALREVFVRAGNLPTQALFDAATTTPFGAEQVAVVSSTEPGEYFIRLRIDPGETPSATPYRLIADLMAFQITRVTPDEGGSARFVTMTIDGAGIKDGAIAKLSRPGFAEYLPVSVKRIDATKMIAIFDLEGAPHGLYDVIVINADGEQAIEPYRYLVEDKLPTDVSVGLSGPRVVPAGQAGQYAVVLDSLTNVDTPYVHFTFGAPEMGSSDMAYGLPYLSFATNLGGGSDAATDGLGLSGAQAEVNLAGELLAPGYAVDLAAEGTAQLNFAVQTYPGLQALIERDFDKLRAALYDRDPALAESDALGGGISDLEAVDPLLYEIMTDPGFKVVDGDLPWYLPFQFNVMAAATPMTRAEFIAAQKADAETLRQAVLADAAAAPALQTLAADADGWTDGFLKALMDAGLLREEADAPPVFEQARVASLVATLAQGLVLGPAGDEIRSSGDLAQFYAQIRAWYGSSTTGEAAPVARYDLRAPPRGVPFDVPVPKLPEAADFDLGLSHATSFTAFNIYAPWVGDDAVNLPDFGSDATTSELVPLDLERLTEIEAAQGAAYLRGPAVATGGEWVPGGAALPHEIGFSLDSEAPQPTRELRIVTKLDPALDARSFRLGGLRLGDLEIKVPAGRAVYQTDIDLSASRGFVLRASAGIDVASGIATWRLQAIDPATGEVLEGSGPDGLLRAGEKGQVFYSVYPADDADDGATVVANATIVSDAAAPQETGDFTYRLDLSGPETSVTVTPVAGTNDIRVDWSVTDAGAGVATSTLYVSKDGGAFEVVASGLSERSYVWQGEAGVEAAFLVLSTDRAGNRETAPMGVADQAAKPDFGVADDVAQTVKATPLAPAVAIALDPANALFIAALDAVPSAASAARPSVYSQVIAPFSLEAFAGYEAGGQGAVGVLAVAELADGAVLYSGGPDRAWLYKVDDTGAGSGQPLARLDAPIYDLAQAPDGRLWATTGGGALLELDPETGAILNRYGAAIGQSVAVDGAGQIYVSTNDGIARFDPESETFTSFASGRVGDLAIAPDGTLWATGWPERGSIIRYAGDGTPTLIAQTGAPVDSLTFGRAGSEFDGLAIATSVGEGGASRLFAVDLASFDVVSIAAGATRGEGITTLADGRILLAHSSGLDTLRPLRTPTIVATSVQDGATFSTPIATFSVQFDDDMATDGAGSVLDPINFALVDQNGAIRPLTALSWDAATRTVTAQFESLPLGIYAFNILDTVQSSRGQSLGETTSVEFTRLSDVTADVQISFRDTRYDRETGIVTYAVTVKNIGLKPLKGPIRLTLDPADPDGSGTPLVGEESGDIWLVDLSKEIGPDNMLAPGESTEALAVSLLLSNEQRAIFRHGVRMLPGVNAVPVFGDSGPATAQVGEVYSFQPVAVDIDSAQLGYTLVSGPQGMQVDAETGALSWTPDENTPGRVDVALRVYDGQGAFDELSWQITVEGVNHAPALEAPAARIEITEGELLQLPYLFDDEDFDAVALFADNLPPGAYVDHVTHDLVWRPQPGQAGQYLGVVIGASDGALATRRSFDLVVTPGVFAPIVATPVAETLREGDPLRVQIRAEDADGAALTYTSPLLPADAHLDPVSGVFEWTPRFTQAGQYAIPIDVSNGDAVSRVMLNVEVENANGAPELDGFDNWVITEGQRLVFRTTGFDPDNPAYVLPERAEDGALLDYTGSMRKSLSYAVEGLPDGATFDADTGTFNWLSDYASAGLYHVRLIATDDGDGTGTPLSSEIEISIRVEDFNRPPVLSDLANITAEGGEVVRIPLSSLDPDGGALSVRATATRAAGADQIDLDPTPIALDGSSGFGRVVQTADGLVLEITPGDRDRGDWRIDLVVQDDGNGNPEGALGDEGSFILTVEGANLAPTLARVAGLVGVVGEELSFTFEATDPERGGLSFEMAGLPDGAVLDTAVPGKATLRFTPTAAGDHTLTLSVRDGGNGDPGARLSDTMSVPVVVRSDNAAPLMQPLGPLAVAELETLDVTVSASDPDGDPLTYAATGLPDGAVLDPLTGRLSFTPGVFQAGVYEGITIRATDGSASDTITTTLTVTNTNRPPALLPIAPQTALEGQAFSFRLLASDIDGDPVVFAVAEALPRGTTLDPRTGVITWTPGFDQAGLHTLKIAARDPEGAESIASVAVNVLNQNRAPELALETRTVVLGETLDVILPVSDPDADDTLMLAIANLPANASFEGSTGRLRFTPDAGDLGDLVLRISAEDGHTSVAANMLIKVTRQPILPTAVLDVTPGFPARPGQTITLSATGDGVVPIASMRLTVEGEELPLDALGRAQFVAEAPGKLHAVLEVTDRDGRIGTVARDVVIRLAGDVSAPVVTLDLPEGPLGAETALRGSVADQSLAHWALSLVHRDGTVRELATGESSQDGVLAQLGAGDVPSGHYILRLEASDLNGLKSIVEKEIEVLPGTSDPTLGLSEAVVTLSGINIPLTRVYQPERAGEALDFGQGWAAPWLDAQLDAGAAGALGAALKAGQRIHLTAPDGQRVVFTATLETTEISGFHQARLGFTADQPGYALSFDGPLLTEADGAVYSARSGLPYSPFAPGAPVTLSLTQPDGMTWEMDGGGSITGVRQGAAHVLIADSGLIGSDGGQVTLLRNAMGAIAGLTLPDGEKRLLLYDDFGRLSFVGGPGQAVPDLYGYDENGLSIAEGRLAGVWQEGASGPLNHSFGGIVENSDWSVTLGAGQSRTASFMLRESELESAGGRVLISVRMSAPGGNLRLDGEAPVSLKTGSDGAQTAIFAVQSAGLHLLVLEADSAVTLNLNLTATGDLDGDGDVSSADRAAYEAAARDIDGDGAINATDRALLLQNYGLRANRAPVLTPVAQKTYADLAIAVSLAEMAGDPEGDPVFFEVIDAPGATATISADGATLLVTPEAGRTAPVHVKLRASDGYRASGVADLNIEISAAALTGITLENRAPLLSDGEWTDFAITGEFADGGTAALPEGYVTVSFDDPSIARLVGNRLQGRSDGYSVMEIARGAIHAATVVRVGALSPYDQALIGGFGSDIYPDAVEITPGADRQLLLFDHRDENVVNTRMDEVKSFVLNGDIARVTADGRVVGLAPGRTELTVIYRASEITIPVNVMTPVVGDAVPVGAAGGVVQNADGYQVAIAEGALPRDTEVTITTLGADEIGVPLLRPEDGFTFGAAFNLETGNAPQRIPAQFAIPTGLAEGARVIFYRITDFVTEDGVVKGYQEVESGVVGAGGIARTMSPPHGGVKNDGPLVIMEIATDFVQKTVDASVKQLAPSDRIQATATAQAIGGSVIPVGALSAGAKMVLTLPRAYTAIKADLVNSETLKIISSKTLQIAADLPNVVVNLFGSLLTALQDAAYPLIESAEVIQLSTDATAVTKAQIEIKGLTLTPDARLNGKAHSWVVFGDFAEDELNAKLIEAETEGGHGAGYVVRADAGDAVAVLARQVERDGEPALLVTPPRDVSFGLFRVARPKLSQMADTGEKPSALAQGTPAEGAVMDVAFQLSDSYALAPGLDTFVAVQQGYSQPDSVDVEIDTSVRFDQVAVLRPLARAGTEGDIPQMVGRIPIGYLDQDGVPTPDHASAGPGDIVLSQDSTLAFVALTAAKGIAVVDTVAWRQIDVDPDDTEHVNFIQLNADAGIRIGEMFVDRGDNYLFVTDQSSNKIHVIGINPSDSATYLIDFTTLTLPDKRAITSVALTQDYKQIVVAQSGAGTGARPQGLVSIFDMPTFLSSKSDTVLSPVASFGDPAVATDQSGLFLREPRSVTTTFFTGDSHQKIVILESSRSVSGADYGGLVVVLDRSTLGEWTVQNRMNFGFPPDAPGMQDAARDPFGVADPVDIVFSETGETAFILGQRRFAADDVLRDPDYSFTSLVGRYRANPPGSNLAVVSNLLSATKESTGTDAARVVAATLGIPESWGSALGLSPDHRFVYMSGGRLGNVLAYDSKEIERFVTDNPDERYYDYALDDLGGTERLEDGAFIPRIDLNETFGPRAAYGAYYADPYGKPAPYVGPGISPTEKPNQPILLGGLIGGMVSVRNVISLDPEADDSFDELTITRTRNVIDLPTYQNLNNPQPTFVFELDPNSAPVSVILTLSVFGPDAGLYVGDTTPTQGTALSNLGYKDLEDATSRLDGNRNRIATIYVSADDIKKAMEEDGGRFKVTLPPETVLTAGQRYFWGVESMLSDDTKQPDINRKYGQFYVNPVKPETGAAFAGVAVLTHGLSLPFIGPEADQTALFEMAVKMAEATDGAVLYYDPLERGETSSGSNRYGAWVNITPDKKVADANALILVPDWTNATTIGDTGFAEAAADAFFAEIVDLDNRVGGVLSAPLHFIAEGRGTAVNTEIVQRLLSLIGEDKLGPIQVTTIDPLAGAQPQRQFDVSTVLGFVEQTAKLASYGFALYAAGNVYATIESGGLSSSVTVTNALTGIRYYQKAQDFAETVGNIKTTLEALKLNKIDLTDFSDPATIAWNGVGFADNYFQTVAKTSGWLSFTTKGTALKTANVNLNLSNLPGFIEDDALPDTKIFGLDKTQFGIGLGNLNQRAVGWYTGTTALQSYYFDGFGGLKSGIWRSPLDRFEDVVTSAGNDGYLEQFGRIARYYDDDEPATPEAIADNAAGYDKNLKSWYVAREFETNNTGGEKPMRRCAITRRPPRTRARGKGLAPAGSIPRWAAGPGGRTGSAR